MPTYTYDDHRYDDRCEPVKRTSAVPYRQRRFRITEDEDVEPMEEEEVQEVIIPTRRSSHQLVLRDTSNRQPARMRNRTTETIPIQSISSQKIQPTRQPITRRGLLTVFGSGATVFASGLVGASYAQIKYSEVLHQFSEGKSPATSLALVCGHNHDSARNPTWLHAYLTDDIINFVELPAGDASKAHIYQSQSLREVGYQGSLSNVYLELLASVVSGGAHQVILRATCEDVALLTRPLIVQWLLVDSKGYFHTAQPQK